MSITKTNHFPSGFNNSILQELLEILLCPETGQVWLQKLANILQAVTLSRYLSITTFSDNVSVYSGAREFKKKDFDSAYSFPLSVEGCIEIVWEKELKECELKECYSLFSLLTLSLENRAKLIGSRLVETFAGSLDQVFKLTIEEADLRKQIKLIVKEVSKLLKVSRVHLKVFSSSGAMDYDNSLGVEVVSGNYVESISIIPALEKEWISKLEQGDFLYLNQQQFNFKEGSSANVESLLSIKSVLGLPVIFQNKNLGVMILHQCDYERIWTKDEIMYLKQISFLLVPILFKLIEEKKQKEVNDIDDFFKELEQSLVDSKLSNKPFSLILVKVDESKEINSTMGFVANNLVLSQTVRAIKRFLDEGVFVGRYSNDEFVIILKGADQLQGRIQAEKLKDVMSNLSVLGVGPVDYNFSFVTFPTHAENISELLSILEQTMFLSKSRGKQQVSGIDEFQGKPTNNWHQVVSAMVPEIILKKSSFKTGPDVLEKINKQLLEQIQIKTYNADILDSIQSLALALDAKDSYTENHSKRVAEYAFILAKNIGLDFQEIEWVRLAAAMHDIGKIGIPENILSKPAKLTKEEFEIMKKHPIIGAKILKPIKPLEKVANLVLYHHEYWDGTGYPHGLSKEEIPVGARIVSIVDAFQAMTSNRPYRNSLPFEEAIRRLRESKEKQWDPDLVESFISVVSKEIH